MQHCLPPSKKTMKNRAKIYVGNYSFLDYGIVYNNVRISEIDAYKTRAGYIFLNKNDDWVFVNNYELNEMFLGSKDAISGCWDKKEKLIDAYLRLSERDLENTLLKLEDLKKVTKSLLMLKKNAEEVNKNR